MDQELLPEALLKQVSRSFYLSLRFLPRAVRPQIGLAYLLARTTDTVADTELISLENRLNALERLKSRIAGGEKRGLDFGELSARQSASAERLLLERSEESVRALDRLSASDRSLVREVLGIIVSGQELDLRRFATASATNVLALNTDAELDDYTFRVAGCVGEFWTKICRAHLFPRAEVDMPVLLAKGVRFGKGLQLINILRDVAQDVANGRCYIPRDRLEAAGLQPSDLREKSAEPRFRPLYHGYLDKAESHLGAGWSYTTMLPFRQVRLRLACAWPVLLGIETAKLLREQNVLDRSKRIKVNRGQLRRLVARSVVLYPLRGAWGRLGAVKAIASGPDLP